MSTDQLDPSESDYKEKFGDPAADIFSQPDMQGLDDRMDAIARDGGGGDDESGGGDNFSYNPDDPRQELNDQESGGEEEDPDPTEREMADELGVSKSQFLFSQAKQDGSDAKKRWKNSLLVSIGLAGIGLVPVIMFMIFLLGSGFGITQVATVLKNYEYSRFYSSSFKSIVRVFEADASVRSDYKLGLEDVESSSGLAKLRGFDAPKYMNNLEESGTISYEGGGGKVDKITIKGGAGGGEDLTLDIPKNGVRGTSDRIDFSTKLKSALSEASPELKETGFISKTTDAVFERVGVKRYAWEKGAEKFKGKDGKESFTEAQKESVERVKGDAEPIKASLDAQQDTDNSIDKKVTDNIEKGVERPVETATVSDIPELQTRIKTQEITSKVGGAIIAGLMIACTADGLSNSFEHAKVQKTNAMQRQGNYLVSASQQVQSGETNAAAVGGIVKLTKDAHSSAPVLLASHRTDWKNGEAMSEADYPQIAPNGFLKAFMAVGSAASNGWEHSKTALDLSTFGLTRFAGYFGHGPDAWSFSELCQTITKPQVAIPVGIGTLAIAIVGAIPSGGGTIAAEGAADGAAEVAAGEVATEATEIATQQTTAQLVKALLTKPGQVITEKLSTTAAGRISLVVARFAGENAAFMGLSLLMANMASINTNNSCAGTSDSTVGPCAAAGLNMSNNTLERSNNFARPMTSPETGKLAEIEYNEHIAATRKQSFATRFFSLKNPYSLASTVAAGIPTDASSAKSELASGYASNFLSYANPLNLFAKTSVFSLPEGTAFAMDDADVEKANMGIQQWGYTADEQAKMDEPGYSLIDISVWGKQNAAFIKTTDDTYLECFDAKKEWYDLADKCNDPANFTSDQMFKWRLYHRDAQSVDSAIDVTTVTNTATRQDGSTPQGNQQELAKQIVDLHKQGKITYAVDAAQLDKNFNLMAEGKQAITDNGHLVDSDPRILQGIIFLANKGLLQLNSYADGGSHTKPGNPHYEGKAIDIGAFEGKTLGGGGGDAAETQKVQDILSQVLPDGSRFGSSSFSSGTITLNGRSYKTFNDTPRHLHVDVVGVK